MGRLSLHVGRETGPDRVTVIVSLNILLPVI